MKKLLILFALTLLIPAYDAQACSCGNIASPCEAYQEADAVFIGVVKKVKPELLEDKMDYSEQTAFVEVEKGFKAAKAGDEFVFHQPNQNCAPKYTAGERCLFYASYHKDTKTWEVYGCGRTTTVERAHDDLLYLERLPEAAKQTRLSGAIEHYEETPEKGFSLIEVIGGAKVLIIGEKKTVEVYTDPYGVYEVYGLPEGKYTIQPEIPFGLKVYFPMPFGPLSYPREGDEAFQVELRANSCAGADFVLISNTSVTGKVFGANGQIMPLVCLELIPAEEKIAKSSFRIFGCTEEDGRYELEKVPPGKYLIVANKDGRLDGYTPFPTAYYPGVFDKERATPITVGIGDKLDNFDIHIPEQLPTVTIEGELLFSDGRPATDAYANFRVENPKEKQEQTVGGTADHGHFRMRILQGSTGSLVGKMGAYSGKFENCPAIEKLLAGQGGRLIDVETKPIRIDGKTDIKGIKLVFSFGYCKEKEGK